MQGHPREQGSNSQFMRSQSLEPPNYSEPFPDNPCPSELSLQVISLSKAWQTGLNGATGRVLPTPGEAVRQPVRALPCQRGVV